MERPLLISWTRQEPSQPRMTRRASSCARLTARISVNRIRRGLLTQEAELLPPQHAEHELGREPVRTQTPLGVVRPDRRDPRSAAPAAALATAPRGHLAGPR